MRLPTLHLYRAILSVLVAVAIVLAPAASAWAGGARGMGLVMSHTAADTVEGEGSVTAAPMEDCASMMKGAAGTDDCPCCDKDKSCPSQFCMAKCFQFLGLAQQSVLVTGVVTALFRPTAPAHPPDWSDQPQPPPPRT